MSNVKKQTEVGPGHYCYGCKKFFHDSNPNVVSHRGCKGQKSLGICVDRKEFGKYYIGTLLDMTKEELISMIRELTKNQKQ